ncbi:MAG: type II secretion system protein [Enterococcus aquimarinus]
MKVMKRKNNKIRWSDESGMTLVEVLVAIALISMIVTTFLSFFIQAAKTNNRTSDINRATFIAQAHLETLNQYTSYSEIEEAKLLIDQKEEGFTIKTTIAKDTTTLYLTKVTVTKGGKAYAEMQTYLTLTTPPK